MRMHTQRDRTHSPRAPEAHGQPRRTRDDAGVFVGAIPLLALIASLLGGAIVAGAVSATVLSPSAHAASPSKSFQEEPSNGARPAEEALAGGAFGGAFAGGGCARAGAAFAGDCGKGSSAKGAPEAPSKGTSNDDSGTAQPHPSHAAHNSTSPHDDARGCAAEGPKDDTVEATIERAIDGDTVELSEPVKGTRTVRLIGVDTPETVDPDQPPEPYGKEAKDFTGSSLEGEDVSLEIGETPKDDYGRLLAYVWTDRGMFDEELLAKGYGELMIVSPNDAYEECLTAAEDAARSEGLGLWAHQPDEDGQNASPPPEMTGSSSQSASPSASPDDTADDPQNDGGSGFLQTLFGAGDDTEQPRETTLRQPGSPEATEGAPGLETTLMAPQAGLEGEQTGTQEPEIQEPEIQEPEIQNSASPGVSPSASPNVSPSASPTSSPEPEISLPETGGPTASLTGLGAILLGCALISFAALRPRHGHRHGEHEEPAFDRSGESLYRGEGE